MLFWVFHYENRKISIKVDQKCKRAASIYLLSPGSHMEFLFEEELGLFLFTFCTQSIIQDGVFCKNLLKAPSYMYDCVLNTPLYNNASKMSNQIIFVILG